MRITDRQLPFAGTDEELERYLQEFAERTDRWAARDSRRGGWLLSGGAFLSSNPNTLPLKIRIRRDEHGLVLGADLRGLPWTRPKRVRIAAYRIGQLADYLTSRVRGSGPEKFGAVPLREPFASYGSGVAAVTASFSWLVLTGLATFLVALLSSTIAATPLLALSLREISVRSAALEKAGALPLPSPAEAAATGPLLPALVFSVPIAFLFTLLHVGALGICDLDRRASRLPQASLIFQGILLLAAFLPFYQDLSPLAFLLAVAVPAGVHLGSTSVWARRRERIRDGPRPGRALIVIAVALTASLAGAVIPRATDWKLALDRIALFRDAWLLGNPVGRAIATTYYRHTLYSAELLKEFYSADPARARKQEPIAQATDPGVTSILRALQFTVTPDPEGADVSLLGRIVAGRSGREVRSLHDLEEVKAALDDLSAETFRARGLRTLSSLSWHAVYYGGPLAVLLGVMGALSPLVSILFRRLRPQTALFGLSACAIVSSLTIVLLTSPEDESPDLAADLADARVGVRHAAAFRASHLGATSALAEPLLRAADDPDLRVRLWAVAALGKSADARAYPKLIQRLDDPELFVRYRAAEGLGWLRDPRALPALLRMARERSWYEGCYALDALRRIRPGAY